MRIVKKYGQQSEQIVERLRGAARLRASDSPITAATIETAVGRLRDLYDPIRGGWGGAPKFPAASVVEFLLRRGEREMALHTLRRMASGGMYDLVIDDPDREWARQWVPSVVAGAAGDLVVQPAMRVSGTIKKPGGAGGARSSSVQVFCYACSGIAAQRPPLRPICVVIAAPQSPPCAP